MKAFLFYYVSIYNGNNSQGKFLKIALISIFLLIAYPCFSQPAKGAKKFLGNITTGNQVRSDFGDYWNQITGENEHKWESVERTRDQMNWGAGDRVVQYAEQADILWKFHTLVWGSQYPNWITGLPQSEQLAEIEEWFDAVKQQYPEIPMIDVVNEAYPGHAPAPFREALGGEGQTGYDWIKKAFEMARERWPNAILIYNDYNIIEWEDEVNWIGPTIKTLLDAGAPIDAIGAQAHDAYRIDAATLKNNIDKITEEAGIPMFISEFDIPEANDSVQQSIMEEKITMLWNHPKILGVTLWGYVMGQTWKSNTGLIQSNGTPRPAMTWLMNYIEENKRPRNDYPNFLAGDKTSIKRGNLNSPRAAHGVPLNIFDMRGRQRGAFPGNGVLTPENISRQFGNGLYIIRSGNDSRAIKVTQ